MSGGLVSGGWLTTLGPLSKPNEESCEEEGCLSVPEYYARVDRSARVKVRFQDLDEQTRVIEADGLTAIACQHEIDHLDGILFVDHLSPLKRSMFRKKWKKIMEHQTEKM